MHQGDTILISSDYPIWGYRGKLARVVSLSSQTVRVTLIDTGVPAIISKRYALEIPGYSEHKKSGHLKGQPEFVRSIMARHPKSKSRKTLRQQLYEAARRQGKDLSQPIKLS